MTNQTNPTNLVSIPIFDAIVSWLVKILIGLACACLVSLILITCIDVVGRYFLNSPLTGSTELTEITLGLLVFSSLPVICYERKHIVVDVLDFLIPNIAKSIVDFVSYALIGLGFWLIAGYSSKLIERALRRDLVTEYLEIPVGYVTVYAQAMCYVTIFLMVYLMLKVILTRFMNHTTHQP